MPVYNQGEDYEEDFEEAPSPQAAPRRNNAPKDASPSEPEESGEPEESVPKKKAGKLTINPKLIACGVGIIVLIVLIVILAGWYNSKQDAKREAQRQEEIIRQAQEQEDYYNEHPEERPTVSVDAPVADAPVEDVPAVTTTSYSSKELAALRKWGYTASEIEIAARDGITAEGLVKSARKDREAAQKEAFEAVRDTASPEYLRLLDMTWLSGDSIDLSGVEADSIFNTTTRTENVDYEKCGAQGTQLFIKLHLDNGKAAFMTVTPNRYVTLADAGNIVVSISEVQVGELSVITGVQEVAVN